MNALIDCEIVCPYCSFLQNDQVIQENGVNTCEDCEGKFNAIILITKIEDEK